MSTLVFDSTAHTLTLFDAQGSQVGQWPANNLVDHAYVVGPEHGLPFLPNGTYTIEDTDTPHTHGRHSAEDSLNGAYGRFGIIRLDPFVADGHTHAGVGIHAGRANARAQNTATHGCIRTVDAAMEAITRHMRTTRWCRSRCGITTISTPITRAIILVTRRRRRPPVHLVRSHRPLALGTRR